ncbi:class F sortase [Streptomyces subrutilus]|uniref:Class F sortase n=1 Tax=Streptomyces subrutilus TaxID=36818 RepID=A0A5P2USI2_9ACTN|nr:class F sortase [Streptomyces subrutilus]QEU80464.1 class F sortase [Streptomyces subrutilus]WSJ30236.1 class F sortase [Streptomyces subrutilus]GGZ75269.1 class F sortase [Streptomyces subrutilus]
MSEPRRAGGSRLLTFAAWSVLVLGLWLWGRQLTGVPAPPTGPAGGAPAPGMPAAHAPLPGASPQRLDVPSIGIQAPVISRGLDDDGAIEPPPYASPGTVGWWGAGTQPGSAGTALMVGHVDTKAKPAVFFGLGSAQPGEKVRVVRADGSVAEFTIEDVRVYERAGFDPHKAYGQRVAGRAELRLVTCGGSYDKAAKQYTANVVVSAYLTGAGVRPGTAA